MWTEASRPHEGKNGIRSRRQTIRFGYLPYLASVCSYDLGSILTDYVAFIYYAPFTFMKPHASDYRREERIM